ncbi:hypothetical protein BgiBS90_012148, partial [Biomphalaria glabrata]
MRMCCLVFPFGSWIHKEPRSVYFTWDYPVFKPLIDHHVTKVKDEWGATELVVTRVTRCRSGGVASSLLFGLSPCTGGLDQEYQFSPECSVVEDP